MQNTIERLRGFFIILSELLSVFLILNLNFGLTQPFKELIIICLVFHELE